MADPFRLFAPDEDATSAIGAELAAILRQGDLVLLGGDLGAGKTTLARALIRARMGDQNLEVPSPSFALVQPYDTPEGPLLHVDLYRLGSGAAMEELGVLDQPEALVLVEWPDRAPELLTRATLDISLSTPKGGAGRHIVLETGNDTLTPKLTPFVERFAGRS